MVSLTARTSVATLLEIGFLMLYVSRIEYLLLVNYGPFHRPYSVILTSRVSKAEDFSIYRICLGPKG